MKRLFAILTIIFVTLNSSGQVANNIKYDFDESKYNFNSPEDLANTFFTSLGDFKESEYLRMCLSKEATLYMIEQISILKQDVQNIDNAVKAIEDKFDDGIKDYVNIAEKIRSKINSHKIEILNCKIDSMNYKIEDWYRLKPYIMFTNLTMYVTHKGTQYQLTLSQLVRLKGKWFILGPEIYWSDQNERDLIKKQLNMKK